MALVGGSLVGLIASIALVANVARPDPEGGVLGAIASPGSPSVSRSPGRTDGAPDRRPAGSFASPASPASDAPVADDPPVVIAWTDSFDRRRLQIIVPVRNTGDERIRIVGSSGYRLMGTDGELARGDFTVLPALVEPGGTGYLVETRDDPSDGRLGFDVETTITAVRTKERGPRLSVSGLEVDQAIGGGMRARGRVDNDGPGPARPVTVGAIALDEDGQPLGAVVDTHDITRLRGGEGQTFATDVAAGAPVIVPADIETVVAVAFQP